MSRKRERELEARGYHFTGRYTHDRQEAKDYAAELRKQGFRACIVFVLGTRADGWDVYSTGQPAIKEAV